jgi:hypothetical protein
MQQIHFPLPKILTHASNNVRKRSADRVRVGATAAVWFVNTQSGGYGGNPTLRRYGTDSASTRLSVRNVDQPCARPNYHYYVSSYSLPEQSPVL